MTGPIRKFTFSLLTATVLICLNSALARAYEDPDWPCIQRLVPEISAAAIWDGPPIDDALGAWREKPAIRDLVARLAARHTNSEQAERNITAFVKTLKNGKKNPALTMLFAGLWVAFNDKRRTMIEGIKRFARQQLDRANRIEKKLLDLDRISANTTADDRAKIEGLHHDMALEVRIFEDREKSIRYLCEQPVKIESILGGLARTISSQLD
jgi:hypothetical protein|tara:strand:+ start:177 stop:809 length:633 start_codon:yes stop_codon:yes gene_type:complete